MLRRIMLGGVSITTAAMHVCVLCMRYCNGITAYILLHYLMKFHLEITKYKEMTTFLYVLSDHPSYKIVSFSIFSKNRDAIHNFLFCAFSCVFMSVPFKGLY